MMIYLNFFIVRWWLKKWSKKVSKKVKSSTNLLASCNNTAGSTAELCAGSLSVFLTPPRFRASIGNCSKKYYLILINVRAARWLPHFVMRNRQVVYCPNKKKFNVRNFGLVPINVSVSRHFLVINFFLSGYFRVYINKFFQT